MIRYYRTRWPDEEVPPDMPIWQLWEADIESDKVLRDVDIFEDGSVSRNSLDIEARYGPRYDSLLDCSFLEGMEIAPHIEITREEFESYWSRGIDTSFWNEAPVNEIPPRS